MSEPIRTIDVSVPLNEIFEGYCHKCDLQTNDITLIDYTNEKEPVCLNCKEDKVEERDKEFTETLNTNSEYVEEKSDE